MNFKNLVPPIVINEQNHSNFKPKRVSLELITRKKDWYSLYPVNTLNKTILFTNNQFLIVWKSRKSFELHGWIMFVFIFDLTLNQTKGKKTKYCLNWHKEIYGMEFLGLKNQRNIERLKKGLKYIRLHSIYHEYQTNTMPLFGIYNSLSKCI